MKAKILNAALKAKKDVWYFTPMEGKAVKQADNMIRKNRFDCKPEEVIAVMDCTLFGGGKDGYLMTEKGMYNTREKKHTCIAFSEIERAELSKKYHVRIFFRNGDALDWFCPSSETYIMEVLNHIVQMLAAEPVSETKTAEKKKPSRKTAEPAKEGPAVPDRATWGQRYSEAYAYYAKRDYATAFQLFLALAEEGEPTSQANIGFMYENGQGIAVDLPAAAGWFEKAAKQGNKRAQRSLALMYMNGSGVPEDQALSFYWNRQAAEQGDGRAQFDLSYSYQTGIGAEKDLQKAMYWMEKCAEQGYADAQLVCGSQYYLGEWVARDFEKALFWLQKSEAQGNEKATEIIGYVHEDMDAIKAREEAEEKARREAEAKARREAEEKARREAGEKAHKEEDEKLQAARERLERLKKLEAAVERHRNEFYAKGSQANTAPKDEKDEEDDFDKRLEGALATADRLWQAYDEGAAREAAMRNVEKEGRAALDKRDYAKGRACFKEAKARYLFALAAYNDSEATLEELMEAEYQVCEEATETGDAKAIELLEKLRRHLTAVLVNREEERTVDLCGVDLPTRYLALRYALQQNDRKSISTAAYNLAIFYFKRRYDNLSMCGVEEAASLCYMAKEQDRLIDVNGYSYANDVLRDCNNAMKDDYINPPGRRDFNARLAHLDRMAENQPFAAYMRAGYYCKTGKTGEDLWRAEKMAVYAVSAGYTPLIHCFYSPTDHKVVFVDVEQQSPQDLLREIREKLKAKGLPSKYDMTDRWKAHHASLQKLRKAEKKLQKNGFEAAMDAYLFAGEDMEKLKKAKAMAEALRRVDIGNDAQDQQSHRLLRAIEGKISYVEGKQDVEVGNYYPAYSRLRKLSGNDRTADAMYQMSRALLCMDRMADEDLAHDADWAMRTSGHEELKGLSDALKLYAEGRSLHIRGFGNAEYRYRDAIKLVRESYPYPHPFYWLAKYTIEHLTPSYFASFDKERTLEKLRTARAICEEGMAMIDRTTWLTKDARESLHGQFKSLHDDIRSEIRITEGYKTQK